MIPPHSETEQTPAKQSKIKNKSKKPAALDDCASSRLTQEWHLIVCHCFYMPYLCSCIRHHILLWFSSHFNNCSSSLRLGVSFSTLDSGAFLIRCWPILFLLPCIYTVLFQSNYAPSSLSLTTDIILCLSATWLVHVSQKFSPININPLPYEHCRVLLRQSGS